MRGRVPPDVPHRGQARQGSRGSGLAGSRGETVSSASALSLMLSAAMLIPGIVSHREAAK